MTVYEELNGQYGTVMIRDHFWPADDGTETRGVTGQIRVHPAKDVLGFDMNNRDSNWLVEVRGQTGDVVILPGCAVLGFHFHDHDPDVYAPAYLTV